MTPSTEPALNEVTDPPVSGENPPVPLQIGPRLRARREQVGVSLRETARRVGVSASLISQIERNKVNPSVSTLYSLVQELGITMGELFGTDGPATSISQATPPGSGDGVVRHHQHAVINLGSGVHWERLTAASDPLVEFLRVIYEPGSESCPEGALLRHVGKEYGYVTQGRLGVQIGFEKHELTVGDSISFDSSSPHRLWTVGHESAEAVWFVVGRQGDGRHKL